MTTFVSLSCRLKTATNRTKRYQTPPNRLKKFTRKLISRIAITFESTRLRLGRKRIEVNRAHNLAATLRVYAQQIRNPHASRCERNAAQSAAVLAARSRIHFPCVLLSRSFRHVFRPVFRAVFSRTGRVTLSDEWTGQLLPLCRMINSERHSSRCHAVYRCVSTDCVAFVQLQEETVNQSCFLGLTNLSLRVLSV